MLGASTISGVSVTKLRCVSIRALVSLDVPESFPGVRVPGNCAILGRLSFRYCMKWYEHECTIRKEPSVESHKAQKLSELLASDRFRKMVYCLHLIRHRPRPNSGSTHTVVQEI